ncbi:MAG TPA: acyl-CoA dehydrogenase family protein, partial [Polyangia bacterium]|nr:acyl-CoA dehydrogenase family protein [Polyangia bacterium]
MLLELTSEQELFRQTTTKFLERYAPAKELRRLQNEPDGFETEYWRRGAELGWTSLLVAERDGGVSISGKGLIDLTLAAHEFGRHAAPGPLISTNVVAAALSAARTRDDVLARLLD